MNNNLIPFFSKKFTSKAIVLYVFLLLICLIFFPQHGLSIIWIIFGLIEVITFFHFSSVLSKKWANIPEKFFRKKIFRTALTIRVIYVVFAYFFYQYMTGQPFEFEAGDSRFYDSIAISISDLIGRDLSNLFNISLYGIAISDRGFPVYLGIVYTLLFQSLFLARIVNAIIGAWTCLLIYNFTQRNFGETSARIAAVLAVFLPLLIYYTGLTLKETVMVFLLVAFLERADYIFRTKKIGIKVVIFTVLIGISLFFFRTVLALSAWFSIASVMVFVKYRNVDFGRKIMIGIWCIVGILIFFSGTLLTEIEYYFSGSKTNQKDRLSFFASRLEGNTLADYGSTVIFIPLTLVGPLPTMVHTKQDNSEMKNGAIYTRNVFMFFAFIALIALFKYKLFRKNILIISFIFSYLAILAGSGFALSERFHLPVLPFVIILAGYGITQTDSRYIKYYIPYLIIVTVLIIGWNWFKLAGRGLV